MVTTPGVTPVTTPPVPIDAITGTELDQEPPASASLSVTEAPTHTDDGPVIGGVAGMRLTVSGAVTVVGHPKLFVTV